MHLHTSMHRAADSSSTTKWMNGAMKEKSSRCFASEKRDDDMNSPENAHKFQSFHQ